MDAGRVCGPRFFIFLRLLCPAALFAMAARDRRRSSIRRSEQSCLRAGAGKKLRAATVHHPRLDQDHADGHVAGILHAFQPAFPCAWIGAIDPNEFLRCKALARVGPANHRVRREKRAHAVRILCENSPPVAAQVHQRPPPLRPAPARRPPCRGAARSVRWDAGTRDLAGALPYVWALFALEAAFSRKFRSAEE